MFFLSVPVPAGAVSSDTEIVNTHGGKTYLGTSADWNKTWHSDLFTDVTDQAVDCSGDLIIKGGKVKAVSVGGSSLTITGGTMSNVTCEGTVEMSGGAASSLESSNDINISGGAVSGDVDSEDAVTLYGKVTVGGTVTGTDVTVDSTSSSGTATVTDGVSFSDRMILEGSNSSLGSIDGQDSGTLEVEDCTAALPKVSNVDKISVDSDSSVSVSHSLAVGTLALSSGARFAALSTLTAGTVSGPGTLAFHAGSLTVDAGVSDSPSFALLGTASGGTVAFQAKAGAVLPGDVTVFGYRLTQNTYNSSYDKFVLSAPSGNGVTLSSSSVKVENGSPAAVTASVSPAFSQLPGGTQLCWELIDPSSQFSIRADSGNSTCTVSATDLSSGQAALAVYLADGNGNLLSGYQTALCSLQSTNDLSLDTKAVTIPLHHKYFVFAATDAKTPPVQMSYNSAVAVTGKAAACNYRGRAGWLYPITAVSKGSVTICIGGRTMTANVVSDS